MHPPPPFQHSQSKMAAKPHQTNTRNENLENNFVLVLSSYHQVFACNKLLRDWDILSFFDTESPTPILWKKFFYKNLIIKQESLFITTYEEDDGDEKEEFNSILPDGNTSEFSQPNEILSTPEENIYIYTQ